MSSFPPPPSPPLSSPVAIIEPTTTSAVSSPGQYMSPCCTPNQQRGPLPHTNLSRNPLLHLDLFQLAGWNACWVYSFIVSPLFFFFDLHSFFFLILGLFWVGFYSLATYSSCSLCHYACPLFLSLQPCHHHPHVEQTVVSSKWLFHRPLGLMLFIMLMASPSSSFWLFHHKHHLSLAPQCYLNSAHIKGRKLSVAKARGLLFARWNLCFLCTFITSSPSPSLFFCVLIFLYPSLAYSLCFSLLSRPISWRSATLFNLICC